MNEAWAITRGGGAAAGARERSEPPSARRPGPPGARAGARRRATGPTTLRSARPQGGRMSTAHPDTVMAHARRLVSLVDGEIAEDRVTQGAAA